MNYKIVTSGRFKKDYKLAVRRGYDISLLDEIVTIAFRKQNRRRYITAAFFATAQPEKLLKVYM